VASFEAQSRHVLKGLRKTIMDLTIAVVPAEISFGHIQNKSHKCQSSIQIDR
jgi:hypothetical protein